MLSVLILYMSGGTYSLKSTPNDRIFWETFHGNFIYSQSFARNLLRGVTEEIFFFIFSFGCLTWGFAPGDLQHMQCINSAIDNYFRSVNRNWQMLTTDSNHKKKENFLKYNVYRCALFLDEWVCAQTKLSNLGRYQSTWDPRTRNESRKGHDCSLFWDVEGISGPLYQPIRKEWTILDP